VAVDRGFIKLSLRFKFFGMELMNYGFIFLEHSCFL